MNDGTFVVELEKSLRKPQLMTTPEGLASLADCILVVPEGWKQLRRELDEPDVLEVHTLTGLASYIAVNVDAIPDPKKLMLHVQDPWTVTLRGALQGADDRFARHQYLRARAENSPFRFGQFMDPESFIICLNSLFAQSVQRDEILQLVANMRETSSAELRDDGVSQEVKTARSLAFVERTKLPNPVTLFPWRTFREIRQPSSEYVLRARPSAAGEPPTLALFAADGDAWRLEAIEGIRSWLSEHASLVNVIA